MPSKHPLYDQLCEKALEKLPSVGFEVLQINSRQASFVKNGLVVTIFHGGYDMPIVGFGDKTDLSICRSWGPLEFFLNQKTPIYRKHRKLNSFYDFEFDLELITTYNSEITEIVKDPKNYKQWLKTVSLEFIFSELNNS